MSSSAMVRTAETSSEPRQPRRLEKNRNMLEPEHYPALGMTNRVTRLRL